MQSVLPLEVKTLKHKTADQVPADRRFAFYLRFFASTAMSRLRNVRTTRKSFVKEYFIQFETENQHLIMIRYNKLRKKKET